MKFEEIKNELTKLKSVPQSPERWEKQLNLESLAADTPEYDAYYKAVVAEGIRRYGENTRGLWEGMSYEHEFLEKDTPEECIDDQVDAMTNKENAMTPDPEALAKECFNDLWKIFREILQWQVGYIAPLSTDIRIREKELAIHEMSKVFERLIAAHPEWTERESVQELSAFTNNEQAGKVNKLPLKAIAMDKAINEGIDRLTELTKEDFHGYRSEIWYVLSAVFKAGREVESLARPSLPSEWIACAEREPEKDGRYAVLYSYKGSENLKAFIGDYLVNYGWGSTLLNDTKITHWMKLPEVPIHSFARQ